MPREDSPTSGPYSSNRTGGGLYPSSGTKDQMNVNLQLHIFRGILYMHFSAECTIRQLWGGINWYNDLLVEKGDKMNKKL